MILKHDATRTAAALGDRVTSFRGEFATITGWEKPRHEGSTGRVNVKWDAKPEWGIQSLYPSVFDLSWYHH